MKGDSEPADGTDLIDRHGYGRFTVPIKENHFGLLLDHDHSDRVMLMGLPSTAGWRAISSVCLSHQTYVKKAEEWLKGKKQARKIAVLEVDTGEWQTVWEGGWANGIRADWLPKNAAGCIECRSPVPSGRVSDAPCSTCKAQADTDGDDATDARTDGGRLPRCARHNCEEIVHPGLEYCSLAHSRVGGGFQ